MADKEKAYYVPVVNANYIPEGVPYLQGFVPDHLGGTGDDKTLNDIRDAAIKQVRNDNAKGNDFGPFSNKDFDDEPNDEHLNKIDSDAQVTKVVEEQRAKLAPEEPEPAVKKSTATSK